VGGAGDGGAGDEGCEGDEGDVSGGERESARCAPPPLLL
jgi:hypothetical protein